MPAKTIIVLCTCPDTETADRLARHAVEQRLAACANLLPGLRSIYRWQGRVESAQEVLLVFKTTAERYAALEADIREKHPYELPEVVAVPIENGLAAYLDWIAECTTNVS